MYSMFCSLQEALDKVTDARVELERDMRYSKLNTSGTLPLLCALIYVGVVQFVFIYIYI